ncbi:hypothetical protein Mycch_3826 [Mycolicibacterium chubuense NBB4]|uniref:DUF5666 domain-containing protein n=1 Tax=Mycolicibacterium chubuense (strain NBB4) TaxID=710421 RepID=I4BMP5_MYCCN|nr:hypothetical protein [Mycolicibacterium chubuense]AFM18552.1 hypothetical protein Mycch_3826 [Mycolicibacterium chubuense NBB4]
MSTEQLTSDDRVWGSPEPAPTRWGGRETAVAVGIAAVIAALGGAAIYAATGQTAHGAGAFGNHAFGPGGPGFGPGGPGFGPGGPGSPGGPGAVPAGPGGPALHGKFVVPDAAGAFTTVLTQTGTVTASSPTSVTVRSRDGFSQAYSTTADQTRGLIVNEVVTVRAVQQGDRATATEIVGEAAGPPPPGSPATPR